MYYILTEYFLEEYQTVKALFQSERNALIHARMYKSNHANSYIDYRVYKVETGKVYADLKPMYDTRGDKFPW